jgi:hypothetical protein
MTILAIYYTLADIVLLGQCLVYTHRNIPIDPTHLSPATPLLFAPMDEESESESQSSEEADNYGSIDQSATPSPPRWRTYLFNTMIVALVIAAGVIGWAFSADSTPVKQPDNKQLEFNLLGQIFGWLCAALYLGSRVPQLLLNFERKSCEGISFLFFLFACLGNLSYVISILAEDLSKQYLLINASWLCGSVGTLFLDLLIFVQFWTYGGIDETSESESECSSSA